MTRLAMAAAAAVCLAFASPGHASDDGRVWLERMTRALAESNYVGEFRLDGADYTERMRIYHRVRDGRVSERLISLGGSGREMIRDGDEVTAFLPDKRLAVIERQADRGGLLGALPRFGAGLEQWYEVRLVGRATGLSGRPAAVVSVRPRDRYRFGHRLWIDEATSMPVRTELCDSEDRVVERLRFTYLEMRSDILDAELQPEVDRTQFRWMRQVGMDPSDRLPWTVRGAPPGFLLSDSNVQQMLGVAAPVSHLVLSDGLASVSVFIHQPGAGQKPAVGLGRAGAASTFSMFVEGHQVTAVGEVPPATLKRIANGVVPEGRPDGR